MTASQLALTVAVVAFLAITTLCVMGFLLFFRQKAETNRILELIEKDSCTHTWKALTEFARQCRKCGAISYPKEADVPEGMREYLENPGTRLRPHRFMLNGKGDQVCCKRLPHDPIHTQTKEHN